MMTVLHVLTYCGVALVLLTMTGNWACRLMVNLIGLRDAVAGTLVMRPFRGLRIRTHLDLSHLRDRPLSFAAAKLVAVLEQHMPDFRADREV